MTISVVQLILLVVFLYGAGAALLLAYMAGLQAGSRMSRYKDPIATAQEVKEALTPAKPPEPVVDEDMAERELMSKRMPNVQEEMRITFLSGQNKQESNHE